MLLLLTLLVLLLLLFTAGAAGYHCLQCGEDDQDVQLLRQVTSAHTHM